MTANTVTLQSQLMQPVILMNFATQQSAKLAVTTSSASVTFVTPLGTARTSYKITNTGAVGVYIAAGNASATAAASTTTPAANCDYIAPGTVQVLDYPANFNTIAAITASGSSTLEISSGYGN